MNYPLPLSYGDTIGLVTPSSSVKPEQLAKCIQLILSMGYQVELGKAVEQSLHGYVAGSANTRANDLNSMFADPKIKAIFCLRGGYGGTQLMDLLNYSMIRQNPKIFVGYSDVTALHLAFHSLCDFVTFHGPMVSSNMIENFDTYTKNSFFRAINMPSYLEFTNPDNEPFHPICEGIASGRIIGGCLSLLSPSIGTFYQTDFREKILFLEDVGESLPRCDKLMHHLKHSDILSQVNGILLGDFLDCENSNEKTYTMYDFFVDFFNDYNKPVLYRVHSGHDKPMGTIPLGTICTIDTYQNRIWFQYN